jgi:tRNA threonylcarbamoyladenosine dehydratase
VDFDYVTLSSLNRHATAVLSDVGTPKVKCIERTLKQFSRWAEVDARVDIWRKEEGGLLLDGYDWVIGTPEYILRPTMVLIFCSVDAIDNIQTKVDLLKYCHSNGIQVFTVP